jgi:hypothetical protein
MENFFAAILSYPTIVYTILLCVTLIYWILAIVGLVDFESSGPDLDLDIGGGAEIGADISAEVGLEVEADSDLEVDTDTHPLLDGEPHTAQVSTLASYMVALGLGGVPFSIVASLLILFAWVISSIAALWVLSWLPTATLRIIVGSLFLVAALALAIPMTAACVRPMRKLFVTHNAISNAALVGQECVILTGSVDETFGRAEVPARGAAYHIRVVADVPNALKRGDRAFIVEYDEVTRLYRVQAL